MEYCKVFYCVNIYWNFGIEIINIYVDICNLCGFLENCCILL